MNKKQTTQPDAWSTLVLKTMSVKELTDESTNDDNTPAERAAMIAELRKRGHRMQRTVYSDAGVIVGYVSIGGCENPHCQKAITEGRPVHAIPSGFAVIFPNMNNHFTTEQDAVNALIALAKGRPTEQDNADALAESLRRCTGATSVTVTDGPVTATATQPVPAELEEVTRLLSLMSDQFAGFTVDYPGFGRIDVEGGGAWHVGTANGTWGADLFIADDDERDGESPDHSVDTAIPATSTLDALTVAEALYESMTKIGGRS